MSDIILVRGVKVKQKKMKKVLDFSWKLGYTMSND